MRIMALLVWTVEGRTPLRASDRNACVIRLCGMSHELRNGGCTDTDCAATYTVVIRSSNNNCYLERGVTGFIY